MINLDTMIKAQKTINSGRIKRANVILKSIGNADEKNIFEAIEKGTETLMKMSKEQLIYKYLDILDVTMVGLFESTE